MLLNIQIQELADTANVVVQSTATEEKLSFLELASKGGPFVMLTLLIFSIAAFYIFFDRYIAIKKANKEDLTFMNKIREYILEGNIDAAKNLCKNNETPVVKMIEKGLLRIGKPLSDISAAIENVGKLEIGKLEKNIALLATIAGAAPMIGFLGTVIGMIEAFYNMANAGNNLDIGLLSEGIYKAMVTTVGGLVVGIIAYVAYNILTATIQKVIRKLETRSIEFMDLLQEPA